MSECAEPAVGLAQAARTLRVSAGTVRRWLRAGAPCVQPGEVGRGRGARIVVADVAAWRGSGGALARSGADAAAILERVAEAVWSVYARDGGEGEPAHATLGIRRRAAAAFLVIAYQRIHRELAGCAPERLPAQIERLWTISLG